MSGSEIINDVELEDFSVSDLDDPLYSPGEDIESRDFLNSSNKSESTSTVTVVSSLASSSLTSSSGFNDDYFKNCSYLDGQFFKVKNVDNEKKKITAECQFCLPKKITMIKGNQGVSSNFIKHLKKNHENDYEKYIEYKRLKSKTSRDHTTSTKQKDSLSAVKFQSRITDSFSKTGTSMSQRDFDLKIVRFLSSNMVAISIIDSPSFKDLFANTNLHIMSRNTAMKKIDVSCKEIIAHLRNVLRNIDYVCITADIWSTKRRSFLGITCHWIEKDFSRKSAALSCKRFSGVHSYDKIAEIIDEIQRKFGLTNQKIVATVTDNGSNFVKAFKEFGIKDVVYTSTYDDEENYDFLESEDFDVDQDDTTYEFEDSSSNNMNLNLSKHVRCASHTLNLIATTDVKNVLSKNTTLRSKHTNIMNKCSYLWKLTNRPKTAEVVERILGHTLSSPGATRWNSLYDSLVQILKSKHKLSQIYIELSSSNKALRDAEWQFLEEYCTILKPVADALDILQGEENMYFGYILPCLTTIAVKFNKLEIDTNQINMCKPILKTCQDGLFSRFAIYFDLKSSIGKEAAIASFTIPIFKIKWASCFHNICQNNTNIIDINDHIQKSVLEAANEIIFFSDDESLSFLEEKSAQKKKKLEFFEFDQQREELSRENLSITLKKKIELEILQYVTDLSIDFSTLNNYPSIKKLFFRYNTCLPSSAPVERLFSFAQIINAPRRNALSDQNFENLILMKANSARI